MKKDRNAGFTLVELMVTIAVAAVLLVVAVPSFQSMLVNNRISAQTNDLVADLAIARSEAAKRGGRVTVCASDDGATCGGSWANGRIVFTDATTMGIIDGTDVVLKVSSAVKAGDSLNSCGIC